MNKMYIVKFNSRGHKLNYDGCYCCTITQFQNVCLQEVRVLVRWRRVIQNNTHVNALITWIQGAVETCIMAQNKAKIRHANKMRTFAVSYIHHSTNRALLETIPNSQSSSPFSRTY